MVTKQIRKITRIAALCLCLLATASGKAAAQFSITAYPPPYDFTFNDLWHFTATGAPNSNFTQFYVAMRVFDGQNGLLLKSNSGTFGLPAGPLYVNKANLGSIGPFATLYYNSMYEQVVNGGDFFPAGTYNVVLSLLGRPTDGEFSELSDASYSVTIQMFMPPLLIHPEDEDTIDTPFPVLTWLPAYQASSGQQIRYHLYLTEVFDGQTAQQSITANPVYFEQYEIPVTALVYPPGAGSIQLDHTYAWQVAATINGVPVGYSQIWKFTYAIPEPVYIEVPDHRQYYTFFEKLDGAVVPVNENSIRIRIEEAYYNPGEQLSFGIYDKENKRVAGSDQLSIQLANGIRFAEIPLCGEGADLKRNETYLVEISNVKGIKKYLRINNLFDTNNCR